MKERLSARFHHPILFLTAICVLSTILMAWGAWTDSAVNDEVVHIPAGYDYARYFTYGLNPEHPPLVKALSSAPLIFLGPNFPTSALASTSASILAPAIANPTAAEWTIGSQFLYGSGNDADTIVRLARVLPIILTILTVICIYFLSRMLMGPWWSLAPAFLFVFDPTILANGHYVTTDVGAAFGIVSATYFFLQHLVTRSRKSLWLAGVAFGIAQLTKFSTIILIPFFFLLYLAHRADLRRKKSQGILEAWEKTERLFGELVGIFLIGYGVVYLVYSLFLVNYPAAQQVADTVATLEQWLGGVHGLGALCAWMAGNVILRPLAQYSLGVLMVARHVGAGTFLYAFGKVSLGSNWWYFPAVFLLKEPIPILAVIIFAVLAGIKKVTQSSKALKSGPKPHPSASHHAFLVFALLSFIVAYWCISMASPLDHGIRYIIPTFPFIYILAVYAWSRSAARPAGQYIFSGLLLWALATALLSAPYFLSYYNPIAGGTWNGYRWATDSNYDWGQDFLRFQSFMDEHPGISKVAVGYLGRADIHYYLGDRAVDWSSAKGDPATAGIHWFAISIDTLELATQPVAQGATRRTDDMYGWLAATHRAEAGMGGVPAPDYRIGTSIFIYHL